jgi:hypothetical protein
MSPSKLAATQTGTLPAASGATIAANMPVASGGCASSPFHSATQAPSAASWRRMHAPPSGPRTTASTSPSREISTSDAARSSTYRPSSTRNV